MTGACGDIGKAICLRLARSRLKDPTFDDFKVNASICCSLWLRLQTTGCRSAQGMAAVMAAAGRGAMLKYAVDCHAWAGCGDGRR